MNTLTVEEILQSFNEKELSPIRGTYYHKLDNAACAIGAYCFDKETRKVCLDKTNGIDDDFLLGVKIGFDGNSRSLGIHAVDNKDLYNQGYEVGKTVWQKLQEKYAQI